MRSALSLLGNSRPESGYQMMEQLIQALGDELPTAFFMASDAIAVGALRSLQEHQIAVPDRVSLISFNDTSIAKYVFPALCYSDRIHRRNGQASSFSCCGKPFKRESTKRSLHGQISHQTDDSRQQSIGDLKSDENTRSPPSNPFSGR